MYGSSLLQRARRGASLSSKGLALGAAAAFAIAAAALCTAGRQKEPQSASAAAPPSRSDSRAPISPVVLPARSAPRAVGSVELPEAPTGSSSGLPVTVELQTRTRVGQRTTAQRKTVIRTTDRVHVRAGQRAEWLFVRNAVDGRRMAATLIEHARRTLVEYDESELRNAGLGRGWADVGSLGVEPRVLNELQPTGRSRRVSGLRFVQRTRPETGSGPLREVWWNEALALPSTLVLDDGAARTEVTLISLRRDADATLLQDPRQRFPRYQVMAVADYREKHYDHSGETHAKVVHEHR